MEKAILDLTDCKYLLELHERIKQALKFPDYYGRNWDAFWDCMVYESPVDCVEICGEQTVAKELVPSLEKLHALLADVKKEREKLGWQFEYHILDNF